MKSTRDRELHPARWALFAASCLCVALPFLVVDYPPSTDLPQHVAQIRLAGEALTSPSGPYEIQWLTPYALAYALLGALYAAAGPEAAGRLGLLVIALLWTAAAHGLVAARGRSAAAATFASLFVFNHALYWGFVTFLAGWPVFALWFIIATRGRDRVTSWPRAAALAGLAVLLFLSHLLWLGAGVVWLVVDTLVFRPPWRAALARLVCLFPALALAGSWYATFSGPTAASGVAWVTAPWERLSPAWLAEAALGGLRGPAEPIVLVLALVWIGAGLARRRADLAGAVDWSLVVCATTFATLALLSPFRIETAAYMAERWMPFVVVLLLLAVPRPSASRALLRVGAVALLVAFCGSTAALWSSFEERELSGLTAALGALPQEPRLLGLDFVRESEVVEGVPFMQMFAYGQALRGGTVNFTFARFPQSLVRFRQNVPPPWTGGLEWHPEWVRAADFAHFDHVLVNGADTTHADVAGTGLLVPVTAEGRWRLYRTGPMSRRTPEGSASPVRP